jgi:hypothetical protein
MCQPYQKELFQQLINAIDDYAGLLKSVLIEEKKLEAIASGDRLNRIRQLVFLLDSPSSLAVMPAATFRA